MQDSADTIVVTRSSERPKWPAALLGRLVHWCPGRTREDADLRKLQSYIQVVRQQAKIFALSKRGCATEVERQLVWEVLDEEQRCWGKDEDSGNEYADRLGQLLPLVANDEYLCTVLQFELKGGTAMGIHKALGVTGSRGLA